MFSTAYSSSILQKSMENAWLTVVVAVIFRLTGIWTNAYLARHVDKEAIGLINVRLIFLEALITLLSREPIRKACLRGFTNQEANWMLIVNLIWSIVPISIVTALIMAMVWIYWLKQPSSHLWSQYRTGVWVMAISCVIEMFAEPPSFVTKVYFFNILRTVMSLLYLGVRTLVFIILINMYPSYVIHAFSAAQIISTCCWVLGYHVFYAYAGQEMHAQFPATEFRRMFPTITEEKGLQLPKELSALAVRMFGLVTVKSLLSESERYVLALSNALSLSEQGVYDLIQSLGSLPYRLLLKPLEDGFYTYFAHIFAAAAVQGDNSAALQEATTVISVSLQTALLLGFLVSIFGFNYSSLVLQWYGSSSLASGSGPTLFCGHGFAFILLALNCLLESLGMAIMSPEQLNRYNLLLVFATVTSLVTSRYLLETTGSLGLIVGNCVNVGLRVIYNLALVNSKYSNSRLQNPLIGLLPRLPAVCIAILNLAVIHISKVLLEKQYPRLHLLVGLVNLMGCILLYCYLDDSLLKLLLGN